MNMLGNKCTLGTNLDIIACGNHSQMTTLNLLNLQDRNKDLNAHCAPVCSEVEQERHNCTTVEKKSLRVSPLSSHLLLSRLMKHLSLCV